MNNKKSVRAVIINQHSGNYGDDAAGCALVNMLLKDYDAERIDIIYNADQAIPVSDERVHHDLHLAFSRIGRLKLIGYEIFGQSFLNRDKNDALNEIVDIIRRADLVLVAPCGANIGIYKDWTFLIRVLFVIREGKKPVFHLNTIGKSGNILFDALARYALRRSSVYVREHKSVEYIQSLGLPVKWGPDTAFAATPAKASRVEESYIALVPSQLDIWHPYFKRHPVDGKIQNELIPAIARFALENKMQLQILPHLASEEERQYNELIKRLLVAYGVPSQDVILEDKINDVAAYNGCIAQSTLAIGMRYHTAVLAANNAVPFVALAYENKIKEVCAYTRMDEFCLDLTSDDFSGAELERVLKSALDSADEIREKLSTVVSTELRPAVHVVLDDQLL